MMASDSSTRHAPEKKSRRTAVDRQDDAERLYERNCRLADKHNRACEQAESEGNRDRALYHREMAHQCGERALRYRRKSDALGPAAKRAESLLRVNGRTPPLHLPQQPEGAPERQERLRRERKDRQAAAVEDHRRKSANLQGYDPRTAAGRRDHHIDNLGSGKRARSHSHTSLFRRKGDATWERLVACERYELLWHTANADQFRPQSFMPRVDTSTISTGPGGNVEAVQSFDALVRHLGAHLAGVMYFRIIENMGYRGMASFGMGREEHLSAQFLAAVDSAATFFGLAPESILTKHAATRGRR
jgi:hypothetical protein